MVSALLGGLVAGSALVFSQWWNIRAQNRRELIRLAFDAAREDRSHHMAVAKEKKRGVIMPLASYVHFNLGLMTLASRGRFTKNDVRQLLIDNDEFTRHMIATSSEVEEERLLRDSNIEGES